MFLTYIRDNPFLTIFGLYACYIGIYSGGNLYCLLWVTYSLSLIHVTMIWPYINTHYGLMNVKNLVSDFSNNQNRNEHVITESGSQGGALLLGLFKLLFSFSFFYTQTILLNIPSVDSCTQLSKISNYIHTIKIIVQKALTCSCKLFKPV